MEERKGEGGFVLDFPLECMVTFLSIRLKSNPVLKVTARHRCQLITISTVAACQGAEGRGIEDCEKQQML